MELHAYTINMYFQLSKYFTFFFMRISMHLFLLRFRFHHCCYYRIAVCLVFCWYYCFCLMLVDSAMFCCSCFTQFIFAAAAVFLFVCVCGSFYSVTGRERERSGSFYEENLHLNFHTRSMRVNIYKNSKCIQRTYLSFKQIKFQPCSH